MLLVSWYSELKHYELCGSQVLKSFIHFQLELCQNVLQARCYECDITIRGKWIKQIKQGDGCFARAELRYKHFHVLVNKQNSKV